MNVVGGFIKNREIKIWKLKAVLLFPKTATNSS